MSPSDLRSRYPQFIYSGYSWEKSRHEIRIRYTFGLPPDRKFNHLLVFENLTFPNQLDDTIDLLLFQLGLSLIPSYWKTTASPVIVISNNLLSPAQLAFWHNLYLSGMGEYFFKNQINFTAPDFLTLKLAEALTSPTAITQPLISPATSDQVVVSVGGGKDSAVTLELLGRHYPLLPYAVNPVPVMLESCRVAGFTPYIIRSTLDPQILDMNKQGFLNGHVPISAFYSFVGLVVAALTGSPYLAMSNERSSDEGNTSYLGHTINHQYSKSQEFETAFHQYVQALTSGQIAYFSFLRPLYEIQIAKLFSSMPKYFSVFSSCNSNFKIDPALHPQGLWCGNCPKCVSTALLLAPFIGKDKVKQIMASFPPEAPENRLIVDQLLGKSPIKPFECVLTRAEAAAAFTLLQHPGSSSPLLSAWMNNPSLPSQFTTILKAAYFS